MVHADDFASQLSQSLFPTFILAIPNFDSVWMGSQLTVAVLSIGLEIGLFDSHDASFGQVRQDRHIAVIVDRQSRHISMLVLDDSERPQTTIWRNNRPRHHGLSSVVALPLEVTERYLPARQSICHKICLYEALHMRYLTCSSSFRGVQLAVYAKCIAGCLIARPPDVLFPLAWTLRRALCRLRSAFFDVVCLTVASPLAAPSMLGEVPVSAMVSECSEMSC